MAVNPARVDLPMDLEPYLDGLRSAAEALAGSRDAADDLVQDTLSQAIAGIGSLRNREAVGAWLHQILRYRWLDLLRRIGRDRAFARSAETGTRPAPSEIDAEEIRAILDTLDADDRNLLELRYFGGLSSAEIARRLGRPSGTVRSEMFRALTKFETGYRRRCR